LHDPSEQLARLKSWGQSLAPALYREQALYLQTLRACLFPAVRTAFGVLLTADGGDRLDHLDADGRQTLQGKVESLVQRCCSLLTVEQLMDLARQIEREQVVRRLQAQRALLQDQPTDGEPAFHRSTDASPPPAPGQSIELSLSPPIDQPELLAGLVPPSVADAEVTPPGEATADSHPNHNAQDDSSHPEGRHLGDLDLLRSLFVMAGEVMAADGALSDDVAPNGVGGQDVLQGASTGSSDDAALLPCMPLDLVGWMDGLDQALLRRLRNLSHALNVELLRAGLVNSLLPISLLDAALAGQVEMLSTTSNLLRLRVPVPTESMEPWVELNCLLLRPSHLEFDRPDLRRCRSLLRQRRRQLLTMVQQQRHWQRRLTTRQVQQQWWPSPPNHPSEQD